MTYVRTKNRLAALNVEHITRFSVLKTVTYGFKGTGASENVYELRAHQAGPQQPFVLEQYPDEDQAAAAMEAVIFAVENQWGEVTAPRPGDPE